MKSARTCKRCAAERTASCAVALFGVAPRLQCLFANPMSALESQLKRLLHVCADGVAGYRHAATTVRDPALHAILQENASERESIVAVLTAAFAARGAKTEHAGSTKGALHRAWLDAVAGLANDAAVLRECERGEDATRHAFAETLASGVEGYLRVVLEMQLARVVEARARVARARREIEERARPSTSTHPDE